ncbi:MAG TPA: fused MFS/spermidine synthase [Sedimentisphaerales bacterium]|nr:fused MFS/spermidine synthase [Sedimentisphaerales bacterium]
MGRLRDVLRLFVPGATAFLVGGCVTAFGLVATRLASGSLGTSLYTWTSVFGVLLTGLVLGGYLGGRFADRFHVRRTLAVLFGLSSAACVAAIVLNNLANHWLWPWQVSWPCHVLLHVSAVFLIPSLLLGAVIPVIAKMALNAGPTLGRAAGVLCAWGAAGSIVGMSLTAFYLVPSYGCTAIVWLIGAALLGMALLYWTSCWALCLWAMVFATLGVMGMGPAEWAREAGVGVCLREARDPNVIYEDETPYGHIAVRRMSDRPNRRSLLRDRIGGTEFVIGEVTRLHDFHTNVFAALTHGVAEGKSVPSMLVLGSGGYAFPQYIATVWPEARVHVVEIDAGVTGAARQALDLKEGMGIEAVHMDVRYGVEQLARERDAGQSPRSYDFIFADAVGSGSVPFQLVTQEFNEKVAGLLAEDGAYMLALVDTCEGGRLLGALVGTLRQTFSHVEVIGEPPSRQSALSSFVVFAAQHACDARRSLEGFDRHMTFRLLDESDVTRIHAGSSHLVLTDDYAPVEDLVAPVVRQGARWRLARRCLREAEQLWAQRHYGESAQRYQRAAQLDASVAIEAWSRVGAVRLAQDDWAGAIEAFQNAVAGGENAGPQKMALASAHRNLAIALQKTGRRAEARVHLTEAAKWFRIDLERNPNSVVSWDRLGDVLARAGDLKGACEAFDRAMVLEPKNLAHYERLAKLLEDQHRYEEAISVVRRHIALLKELGRRDVALQMGQYVDFLEYQKVKQRHP